MKVCIVTTMFPKYKGDSYGPFVFEEAKFLVRNGVEVHVVTQHNPEAAYDEEVDGIKVHRFRWLEPKKFKALIYFHGLKDNFRLLTYLISLFFNLMWICNKYDIDVIHAHHTIPTGFVGVIIGKIMRIPVVTTAHLMDITTHGTDEGPLENIKDFESNFFFRRLLIFTLNSSKKIIAVSSDLAKKINQMEIDPQKIIVLRNAVDISRFKPIKNVEMRKKYNIQEKEILILFIGHLEPFKGIFELLDAFYEINKKNQNVKLVIIGEGHSEMEVKEIVNKYNLKENITFTGKVSPEVIQNFYQMADIFTLPSYTEGLPLVVIEAMACGLPVVVSCVGGIPEIVKNNVNGFLVPPRNKEKLAQNLELLINNRELREKFGKKSFEAIDEEFNINKKIDKFIKLYKSIINN